MLSANRLDAHAQLDHFSGVNDTTAVKDPAGLSHGRGDADPVDTLLRLVLLRAAHTGGVASLLALGLLEAVGAGFRAGRLDVESVEGIGREDLGALDEMLVEGEDFAFGGGLRLEGSRVGLGVGLAANHLLSGRGSGNGSGRRLVSELVELGSNDNGSAVVAGIVSVSVDGDVAGVGQGSEKLPDLLLDDQRVTAGVEDGNLTRSLLEESLDHLQGGSLTGIRGVLLEGKAENGDLLANKGVVEASDDAVGESITSVLVHLDDLAPVLSDLGKTHSLGKIDQVEHILLEAAATETDTGHQELVTDTGIDTDSAGDLIDVGASLLTDSGDGVDGGNSLGKHRVGDKLGQLRGPDVGGQDAVAGNPSSVDVDESLGGLLAVGSRGGTDQDSVGVQQIGDGGTGSQELGVGEDFEVNARAVHGKLMTRYQHLVCMRLRWRISELTVSATS